MVRLAFQRTNLSIYHYVSLLLSTSFLALSAKCTIFFVSHRSVSCAVQGYNIRIRSLKMNSITVFEMKGDKFSPPAGLIWSFDKDVRAYWSNRLMGLFFHGMVLSDKVKGITCVCMLSNAMVGVKKLNEMRMNPCRGVVNNFSIVKIIRILRSCETKCRECNSIIDYMTIGIKRAGALLTAQAWNRRNFFCDVKEERHNPEGQAKEYQCMKGVAD
jgi:hypothetical protein